MNFHPSILAHATFLERPRSRKELLRVVGLIEERAAIVKGVRERERERSRPPVSRVGKVPAWNESRGVPARSRQTASGPLKCWGCGQSGHFRRDCRRDSASPGDGQSPGGRQAPGRKFKVDSESSLRCPAIHLCGLHLS
jgi:hypothetical protein